MSGNAAGIGDLAFELDCCPDYSIVRQWTASDCSGNVSTCSQTITFGAADGNAGQATQNDGLINEGQREVSEVTVMPNPASDKASFNFKPVNSAKTTLEIFDMTGSKVADIFVGQVEAGMTYRVEFDVQSLATGVYTYRLTNGGDVQVSRLIIGK
ncbi:MAG: T9SS type A sorting domain-containing protein [Flavobacteriales bacterium]